MSDRLNLTRFVYGIGGQRIGKIGRTVDNFSWDLNNDGKVDDADVKIFVQALFGSIGTNTRVFSIKELVQIINEWKQ